MRTLRRALLVSAMVAVLSCGAVCAANTNTKARKNSPQPLTSLQQFLARVQGQPVPVTTALAACGRCKAACLPIWRPTTRRAG